MFGVLRKRVNLHNQDQRWDRERVDTEMKQDISGMSAARKASKSSPCSSGESGSSDSGGLWNKDSLSCLQAISSGPQSMTAELAMTSKIPHRGKAPLASRCNKVHPVQYHNKHRSEHVKDRVLSGSTHGEASKPTQSQDILKSKNKMKHLFSKTNMEIIDFGRPSSAETLDYFPGGATTVPRLSTFDILSSESEEEEADDDLLASWQDTYRERDSITFPRTVSQSSSASTGLSHSSYSLQSFGSPLSTSTISSGSSSVSSDGYSPTPLLEQTRQPHAAPLPPIRVNRGFVAFSRHLLKRQSSCRTLQTSLASSPRTSFCQRQCSLVNREEDAVHEGTSTTHTLQSSNDYWGPSTSGQLDNLNVDDVVHIQECQAAQSLKGSNKGIVCRLKQRLLIELSNEEDQCRICHCGDSSPTNPLLSPCLCSGSLHFIHLDCLKRWTLTKIESGSGLDAVKRCELCMGVLTLDPDTFDLNDYYRRHREEQQVDMTERYILREAAELLAFRSLFSTSLLPDLMTPCSPVTEVWIWPMLPYLIRMRLRRARERRNPSPETSDT